VTLLLVLLLAVLWGAVFIPALVRDRMDSSPMASVGTFRRGMRALSESPPDGRARSARGGRWILMPKTPDELKAPRKRMKRRRRRLFTALVLSAGLTLTLGLIPPLRELLKVHAAVDLILIGYVMYLVQAKHREAGFYQARRLHGDPAHEEPELAKAEHF
jgi:hypothetical protein